MRKVKHSKIIFRQKRFNVGKPKKDLQYFQRICEDTLFVSKNAQITPTLPYSSKSISSINNAVNKDLQSLKSWLDENKLSLNVAKTQSILIGGRYKIRAVEQPDNQKPFLHI